MHREDVIKRERVGRQVDDGATTSEWFQTSNVCVCVWVRNDVVLCWLTCNPNRPRPILGHSI